jgi:hypothetical protein
VEDEKNSHDGSVMNTARQIVIMAT